MGSFVPASQPLQNISRDGFGRRRNRRPRREHGGLFHRQRRAIRRPVRAAADRAVAGHPGAGAASEAAVDGAAADAAAAAGAASSVAEAAASGAAAGDAADEGAAAGDDTGAANGDPTIRRRRSRHQRPVDAHPAQNHPPVLGHQLAGAAEAAQKARAAQAGGAADAAAAGAASGRARRPGQPGRVRALQDDRRGRVRLPGGRVSGLPFPVPGLRQREVRRRVSRQPQVLGGLRAQRRLRGHHGEQESAPEIVWGRYQLGRRNKTQFRLALCVGFVCAR